MARAKPHFLLTYLGWITLEAPSEAIFMSSDQCVCAAFLGRGLSRATTGWTGDSGLPVGTTLPGLTGLVLGGRLPRSQPPQDRTKLLTVSAGRSRRAAGRGKPRVEVLVGIAVAA